MDKNIDQKVVNDFGKEWDKYKQRTKEVHLDEAFDQYFHLLPEKFLDKNKIGFDAGCGSGRWARYIAPKVKFLHCFDPSEKALNVATKNLSEYTNCIFECCSINSSKIKNALL